MFSKRHERMTQVSWKRLNEEEESNASLLALGYACESGHTEVAEILINAGAPVDQPENEGRTPLMKAARAGHTCTVRYLIGKG